MNDDAFLLCLPTMPSLLGMVRIPSLFVATPSARIVLRILESQQCFDNWGMEEVFLRQDWIRQKYC